MHCEETALLIPGYLDCELDPMRSVEVEKHLDACDSCRQSVESQRALQSALRSPSLYYSSPARLEHNVLRAVRKEERNTATSAAILWRRYSFVSTFAALLLLVLGIWRFSSLPVDSDRVANEVLSGHVRSLMANHLTDVLSSDRHTVKPWFNGRVDYSPPVEDMADQGFPLTGGRLEYLDSRPVAALVYMRQKHVINLFLWPVSASDADTRLLARHGYNVIHWTKTGLTYWVVSDLNATELRDFAHRYQERVALHISR